MAGRRTGVHGVTQGGRQGVIRWGPELRNLSLAVEDLREPLFDECFKRTEELRKVIQEVARADAPWHDQDEGERQGYLGPHARKGLFAFKQRQKSGIVLGLSHNPRTRSPRQDFPYGIGLETFEYHYDGQGSYTETDGEGTYAIINPTLEEYGPQLIRRLDGALNVAAGRTPGAKKNGGNNGGSRIAKRF